MKNRNPICSVLNVNSHKLLLVAVMIIAMVDTAFGVVLVDYSGDTLPPPPWELINNDPPAERPKNIAFVQDGVLHMIDNTPVVGNTFGFQQHVPFDPNQIIEVEFRARVLSGENLHTDDHAPFEVWLYNGTVRGGLAVGPQSITALGRQQAPGVITTILNKPINGTDWHVYRYRLDSTGIEWWVDGISVGSATTVMLIPNVTDDDRRINMFITSGTANVELDYLIANQISQPQCMLDLKVSFADETLTFEFNVGTLEPAAWNVWLVAQAEIIELLSTALARVDPPIPVHVSIPFFPSLGAIRILTTLTTPDQGIICSVFETVNTGSPTKKSAPMVHDLSNLFWQHAVGLQKLFTQNRHPAP